MPVKTVSVQQCDKPWITEDIKQMIRNKNKLHKKAKIFNTDQSWKSFRQIRNDLTYAVRKRKLDYLQDLDNRASSRATFGNEYKSNTFECRRSKKYSYKIKHSKGDRP